MSCSTFQSPLTNDEAEFLRCYRQMDLRRRGENMHMVKWAAEKFPMIKKPAAPQLAYGIRIVSSFGKLVAV